MMETKKAKIKSKGWIKMDDNKTCCHCGASADQISDTRDTGHAWFRCDGPCQDHLQEVTP